jgi:hypothetical protein
VGAWHVSGGNVIVIVVVVVMVAMTLLLTVLLLLRVIRLILLDGRLGDELLKDEIVAFLLR